MPKRVALVLADWPSFEIQCPNFNGMQVGLQKLGISYKLFSCRPTLDVDKVVSYEPDLVVYGLKDMVKRKDWRKEIRHRLPNAKIILWYGDLRDEKTGQEGGDLSELDMMFVSNNAQDDYYEKKWKVKCHFMPLGSMIYTPEYKKEFDFPFVFIGAVTTGGWMADRAVQITELAKGGDLKVINARADKQPRLRANIMREMPNIYHSSRISLDWSHFTNIKGYTSNRFWNIPASNGLALTHRFPQCEEFYPEGTRIYFDTIEECIEKKNYYLEHQKEADDIRAAGYEHAKNHTYEHRWKAIFDYLY
jgi:hypothetical protein